MTLWWSTTPSNYFGITLQLPAYGKQWRPSSSIWTFLCICQLSLITILNHFLLIWGQLETKFESVYRNKKQLNDCMKWHIDQRLGCAQSHAPYAKFDIQYSKNLFLYFQVCCSSIRSKSIWKCGSVKFWSRDGGQFIGSLCDFNGTNFSSILMERSQNLHIVK